MFSFNIDDSFHMDLYNDLKKNNIFEILKDEILEIKLSDFGELK